jgi:hypothetical protein
MTDLLERVFERAQQLPEDQQNALAELWLAELEDEARWDETFATPESQAWLDEQATRVRAEILAGRTRRLDTRDL